jgi:membrane fusion protein
VSAEPQQPLFREEVLEARRTRLEGEIVLTQPLRVRGMVLLLFALIAVTGVWISTGHYARTEIARGILVADESSANIVAMRPGQVTQLLVKEGDLVRPGQRLASIRVEQAGETGVSAVGESLAAVEAQQGLVREQVRLAGSKAESDRSRISATLAGIRQQRSDLAGQSELQQQVVASYRDTFERVQSVVEKGFISRIEVERRRQAWFAARQELARLQQQSNALLAEERRAAAELQRIAADNGSEVAAALSSAESLVQQRARLGGERAYTITAPIAGRVTAIQTGTGRSVDSSRPLMAIVPERSQLHADVYAPTRAIGFVKAGQEVRLLYDAFPYQRFGSFRGRITAVSRVVLDPRELSAPLQIEEPVYRIVVTPDRQTAEAYGDDLPLQPGMTLTANLVLDRQSFLDWLLKPLNAVMRRSESG